MSVCVHGLGYIGLATASLFANNGHGVKGYDTDTELRNRLRAGDVRTTEPSLTRYVERALADGITVVDDPVPADYHVVCVPTPIDEHDEEADLTYVTQAVRNIAAVIRPDDVVVLESTVPPGTTRQMAPVLAKSGYEPGIDFGLGYTPETVLPGNTVDELVTNDRIVGGIDTASTEAIVDLFDPLTSGTVHRAPDATTAEFVKLVQNAHRYVNIAYANMLALLANELDVDVRGTISLANRHPRVDILSPGPGVGGHCLPVDPHFLSSQTGRAGLLEAAEETNERMPEYVVDRLAAELGGLADTSLALLGIAYKGNVADTRNSPGLAVFRELQSQTHPPEQVADGGWTAVDVDITDARVDGERDDLVPLQAALDGADAAIITAGHDRYTNLDPGWVAERMAGTFVLDTLGILDGERWARAGLDVVGL